MYWLYFWRLFLHKWYVFDECRKAGILWRGIWHDMSKYLPSEFFPYARRFYWVYSEDHDEIERWKPSAELHKARNRHHHEWWIKNGEPQEMDEGSRLEMLCDWKAMAREHAGMLSALEYYKIKGSKLKLHPKTREWVESELGVTMNTGSAG